MFGKVIESVPSTRKWEGKLWELGKLPKGLKVNCRRKEYLCKLALSQVGWDRAREHAPLWNEECEGADPAALLEAVYENIMRGRLLSAYAQDDSGIGNHEVWMAQAQLPKHVEGERWEVFPTIWHFLY